MVVALIEIGVTGNHVEDDLRSLYDWLLHDPQVRRSARLSFNSPPLRPGEMGTLIDCLQLVTGNIWSALSFVTAVAAWRRTRPGDAAVTIRRGATEVTLTGSGTEEIERVVRALEGAEDGEA